MVVIGAGAAGMMCAIEAGKRGLSVLVIDHAAAPGEKIRISGGGRCNFTNTRTSPANFLSANPRFCISALSRYTPRDIIALVDRHGIAHHEKTLGQLFCDGSAKQVVAMLLSEMNAVGAKIRLSTEVASVTRDAERFTLATSGGPIACASLVVASGGKSIPKMGASSFGYALAEQFGLRLVETRPALVPLSFEPGMLERLKPLIGVATDVVVSHGKTRFEEAMLFTHRGLSGPAILQISSYWREGDAITVDFAPGVDIFEALRAVRASQPRQSVSTALAGWLPRSLAQWIASSADAAGGNLADQPDRTLRRVAEAVNAWSVKPVGSEGYRTAEVTRRRVRSG